MEPRPQFLIRDYMGREYGVVEHYNSNSRVDLSLALLEFLSPGQSEENAATPRLWLDLITWQVLEQGRENLPEPGFAAGLERYIQNWSDEEKSLRLKRCRQARLWEVLDSAAQGYSIAYQELFPRKVNKEDFPTVEHGGGTLIVDDQYVIRPGDGVPQVTLILVPENVPGPQEPILMFNWVFGQGYALLKSSIPEEEAEAIIESLAGNRELQKIYRVRWEEMRKEGVLLEVPHKPYGGSSAT